MKKIICLFSVILFFYSCEKEECQECITEQDYPKTLEMKEFSVTDMYIYSGPDGACDNTINYSFLEEKWGKYVAWNRSNLLKITTDSVYLIDGNLVSSWLSKKNSNAIYILMADDKWHYFGEWINRTFVRKVNFRFGRVYFTDKKEFAVEAKNKIGEAQFDEIFKADRVIKDPRELIYNGDTISWTNVRLIYNIIK